MSTTNRQSASELYELALKDPTDAVDHLSEVIEYLQTGTDDEQETAVGVLIEISEYEPRALRPHIRTLIDHFLSSPAQRERLSLVVGNVAAVVPTQTAEYHQEDLFSVFTDTTSAYTKAHLLPWFSRTLRQTPDIVATVAEEAALLLENNRTSIRQRCLDTLSVVASTYPDAIEPYVELFDRLLEHPGTVERAGALIILSKHARHREDVLDSTAIVEAVATEMRSQDEVLRARATEGAGVLLKGYPEYWSEFNAQLLSNLADPSDWVRREAGRACLNLASVDASLIENPAQLHDRLRELDREFKYIETFGDEAQAAFDALDTGGVST